MLYACYIALKFIHYIFKDSTRIIEGLLLSSWWSFYLQSAWSPSRWSPFIVQVWKIQLITSFHLVSTHYSSCFPATTKKFTWNKPCWYWSFLCLMIIKLIKVSKIYTYNLKMKFTWSLDANVGAIICTIITRSFNVWTIFWIWSFKQVSISSMTIIIIRYAFLIDKTSICYILRGSIKLIRKSIDTKSVLTLVRRTWA